ncbi:MacS family sensor histidine kinase [Actinophytocola sp.]|uniref:MacS family sensor histidine kinase n=1 Tax=Actinophytocola sp. TaxID=1872138 RepID=UPI003899B592
MIVARQGQDPTLPFWRAAVILRIVTLFFALAVIYSHRTTYERPQLAFAAAGVMIAWTAVVSYRYWRPNGPNLLAFTIVDLAICCVVMTTSRWVLTPAQLHGLGTPLIPTIWVTGVVAAGALSAGAVVGTVFGGVVAAFNYGVRGYFDIDLTRDLFLLVGIGFVLGLAATSLRRSAERLAEALRVEAATAERERLARSIHDSVLQVLARVRRRGAELGGEAAELAKLAGQQEVALRALVSSAPAASEAGMADLGARLKVLETDRVAVSAPATSVLVPAVVATELTAAVREALNNVDKHAGAEARAWVLLEDLGSEIVVSVRDDGVGIAPERVTEAEREGRMGIAKSLRGRIAELGGTVTLETAPGEGVEWELRVAR